jgi:hypothetical protein
MAVARVGTFSPARPDRAHLVGSRERACDTARPGAFAVLRLIDSLYLVDALTGRSAEMLGAKIIGGAHQKRDGHRSGGRTNKIEWCFVRKRNDLYQKRYISAGSARIRLGRYRHKQEVLVRIHHQLSRPQCLFSVHTGRDKGTKGPLANLFT